MSATVRLILDTASNPTEEDALLVVNVFGVVLWSNTGTPAPARRIVQTICRGVSSWAVPIRREGERGNGPHLHEE